MCQLCNFQTHLFTRLSIQHYVYKNVRVKFKVTITNIISFTCNKYTYLFKITKTEKFGNYVGWLRVALYALDTQ